MCLSDLRKQSADRILVALFTGGFRVAVILAVAAPWTMSQNYVEAQPATGDGIYSLLRRYEVPDTPEWVNLFRELNQLSPRTALRKNKSYRLPILRYTYNGRSIRSTLNIDDFAQAQKIADFNNRMTSRGLRTDSFIQSKDLWVPLAEISENVTVTTQQVSTRSAPPSPAVSQNSLFGDKYANVTVRDQSLQGHVYYLISGHGGPDPGAQTNYQGYTLSEDEYAYDVTLRLARRMMEHSATVYVIVRDPDDGIRDRMILPNDTDEVFYPNTIPKGTLKERLILRSDAVNALYDEHEKTAVKQRALMVHVDSRDWSAEPEQIDVHFLYSPASNDAREVSRVLADTFREKYALFQPGRGYQGRISPRDDLHMLNQTKPVAVLVELGNIQHSLDRTRIMQSGNRQALANWLADGLLREAGR